MRWDRRWLILAYGMLVPALTLGTALYCFTFWVYPWTEEFHVSVKTVMTAYFILGISGGLMSPLVGRYIDKAPLRILFVAGAVIFSTGIFLISLCTAIWQIEILYATLVPLGFIMAGLFPAQALAIRWFPERRGLVLGLIAMGPGLGGLLLPQLVARLLEGVGWRETHMVLAVISLVLILPLGIFIVRDPPGATATVPAPGPASPASDVTIGSILRGRAFWVLAVTFTAVFIVYYAFMQSVRPFTADLGLVATKTATLLSVIHVVRLIGNAVMGALSDRVDQRILVAATATILGAGIWAATLTDQYFVLLGVAAVIGFASGGLTPLMSAVIASTYGQGAFGRASGLLSPFMALSAVGAVLVAAFREEYGSFPIAFRIVIALILPLTAAIFLVKPRKAILEPSVTSAVAR